jgi:hypothetical protein
VNLSEASEPERSEHLELGIWNLELERSELLELGTWNLELAGQK